MSALVKGRGEPLLKIENLRAHFPVRERGPRQRRGTLRAVDGVTLTVREGETLGLVGESGSGKSTLARSTVRLVRPSGGRILFRCSQGAPRRAPQGPGPAAWVDLLSLSERELFPLRREIQMIFQDPLSSLNPRLPVGASVREPLEVHYPRLPRAELDRRVKELLEAVGLSADAARRLPHQFSGGQRQRIGIARALVLRPRLVIADEPVAALDVSIQGQVLNLLVDLQRQFGLTYILIAHDLAVVRHVCDRVAVMYLGRIVECAPCEALFRSPRHPYTEALLSAAPRPDPTARRRRILLRGGPPSPLDPPAGCPFHSRCPYAREAGRWDRCAREAPALRKVGPDHEVACHFAGELRLAGA